MTVVVAYGWHQRRKGGLDQAMRTGLLSNLLATSLLWLRANKATEGAVLFVVQSQHGLTFADLFAIPSAVLGTMLVRDQVSARLKRR